MFMEPIDLIINCFIASTRDAIYYKELKEIKEELEKQIDNFKIDWTYNYIINCLENWSSVFKYDDEKIILIKSINNNTCRAINFDYSSDFIITLHNIIDDTLNNRKRIL